MMPKRANALPMDECFCTNMDDPANAHYLHPLENAEDEDMAQRMAERLTADTAAASAAT